jgi:hypothetical protein
MSVIITESHISKVKVYEDRINLRRLMALQRELAEKNSWIRSYEYEPNPFLTDAAKNVRERLEWIKKEIRTTENKLSSDTRMLIEKK